jgi:hypothetical protein
MITQLKARCLFLVLICMISINSAMAQDDDKKVMDVYGFIMMDAGYNANSIDPNWFDVVRPTKLPAYQNQYGADGNFYFSVRQTRFGVKNYFDTPKGKLFTQFEFEMFGTGVDAGQTTIRLRHAYAELGAFGVGQYWSPFMDIDVFPNTVEYWGPNGMVFFRNVQARWMPIKGPTRLTIALERPGASADQGNYSGNTGLSGVVPVFKLPDLSAEYRRAFDFGYVELSGIARSIAWKDLNNDGVDLSGSALGWGLHLSTNVKFMNDKVTFRGSAVYGEGIQNYMNDATVDVGIKENFSDPTKPLLGVALPMYGLVGFFDIAWNAKMSTAIGYSTLNITNSDGQAASAFHSGNYAAANLMFYPVQNAMVGVELQYGTRANFEDGWTSSITKVQFTAKYNFSQSFYKQ